jgi:N-acyl-D-amino-acid deacylase
MKSLVDEGMKLGAVGLSTGLMYPPGIFSDTDEIIALARVVAKYNGIYDSHVRNPVHELLESDREVIEIARRSAIGGKIGHLKAVGLQNAGLIHEVIELVNQARADGLNIVSDQYPYDGAQTARLKDIIVIPPILNQNGFVLKEALADKDLRSQLRYASENGIEAVNDGFAWLNATGYTSMRIVQCSEFPELVGKYLSELAEEENVEPFDKVAQLLIDAEKPILMTLGAIKESDVQELMVQPWNMIASDGLYVDPETRETLGHPRSTGTFPRVLGHYVRELELLSLEEAIRKMTSLPADFLKLSDRGRIQKGNAADVVIFDPKSIRDTSTWTKPNSMAIGVRDVLVNGKLVLKDGQLTETASGQFLKRNSPIRD